MPVVLLTLHLITAAFSSHQQQQHHDAELLWLLVVLPLFTSIAINEVALPVQHPGSISQTEAGDMETDGIDSDDDNDMLQKSDQVRRMFTPQLLHAPGAVPPASSH